MPSGQIPLNFSEPPISFGSMSISDANRAVVAAIRKVDRWPYHGFTVIGPPKSGLTTLARAWARERSAVYLTGAGFDALKLEQIEQIAEQDIVVDDVDLLQDANALLMALSAVKRRGQCILLTSHIAPAVWSFQSPDLRSRLKAAPLAQVPAPDEELMRYRLSRALARSCLEVPKTVEDYLVTRLGLDYSVIEEAADLLAGASGERPLSIPLAREILEQYRTSTGD